MTHSLSNQLKHYLTPTLCSQEVFSRFLRRIEQGGLTRAEDSLSHACVYFAAYDGQARQVFLGHHRKSSLWLFTGGHIEPGEVVQEAVAREIGEEWGRQIAPGDVGGPDLFTITTITQPNYPCQEHYDIWVFFPVKKDEFCVDPERLGEEFYTIQWMGIEEARRLVIDPNTLQALSMIEQNMKFAEYFL
jgi:8-oxo-dGTP pyrophosphatase MutT (NUDIX family)